MLKLGAGNADVLSGRLERSGASDMNSPEARDFFPRCHFATHPQQNRSSSCSTGVGLLGRRKKAISLAFDTATTDTSPPKPSAPDVLCWSITIKQTKPFIGCFLHWTNCLAQLPLDRTLRPRLVDLDPVADLESIQRWRIRWGAETTTTSSPLTHHRMPIPSQTSLAVVPLHSFRLICKRRFWTTSTSLHLHTGTA